MANIPMMQKSNIAVFVLITIVVYGLLLQSAHAQQDPYEEYVKHSKDFKSVKQDKGWALKAWPSWTYMPWSYQWNINRE
jgi:hypothetical protein